MQMQVVEVVRVTNQLHAELRAVSIDQSFHYSRVPTVAKGSATRRTRAFQNQMHRMLGRKRPCRPILFLAEKLAPKRIAMLHHAILKFKLLLASIHRAKFYCETESNAKQFKFTGEEIDQIKTK